MSAQGSCPGHNRGETPDVTSRVMQRLGYVQADAAQARAARRRLACVRALQGTIVMSAVALGVVWWFGGAVPAQRGPEVVDTLRGSLARGAGELDGFLAGLPRIPQTSVIANGDSSATPSSTASLDHAPQPRSY